MTSLAARRYVGKAADWARPHAEDIATAGGDPVAGLALEINLIAYAAVLEDEVTHADRLIVLAHKIPKYATEHLPTISGRATEVLDPDQICAIEKKKAALGLEKIAADARQAAIDNRIASQRARLRARIDAAYKGDPDRYMNTDWLNAYVGPPAPRVGAAETGD